MQVERPRIRARDFGARNFKPEGVFRSERGQKIQPRYRSMFRGARPVDWGLNGPAVSPRLIPSAYFRHTAQPNRHFSRAGRQAFGVFPFGEGGSVGFPSGEGDSAGFPFGEPRETRFRQIRPRQTHFQQTGPRETRFRQENPRETLFQQIGDPLPVGSMKSDAISRRGLPSTYFCRSTRPHLL